MDTKKFIRMYQKGIKFTEMAGVASAWSESLGREKKLIRLHKDSSYGLGP